MGLIGAERDLRPCLVLNLSSLGTGSADTPRMAVPALAKALSQGKIHGLAGAARRVGLRVEVQNQLPALEVGQRDLAAAVAGQGEGRGLRSPAVTLAPYAFLSSFSRGSICTIVGGTALASLVAGGELAIRAISCEIPCSACVKRLPAARFQTGGPGDARSGMTDQNNSPRIGALQEMEAALERHRREQAAADGVTRRAPIERAIRFERSLAARLARALPIAPCAAGGCRFNPLVHVRPAPSGGAPGRPSALPARFAVADSSSAVRCGGGWPAARSRSMSRRRG